MRHKDSESTHVDGQRRGSHALFRDELAPERAHVHARVHEHAPEALQHDDRPVDRSGHEQRRHREGLDRGERPADPSSTAVNINSFVSRRPTAQVGKYLDSQEEIEGDDGQSEEKSCNDGM